MAIFWKPRVKNSSYAKWAVELEQIQYFSPEFSKGNYSNGLEDYNTNVIGIMVKLHHLYLALGKY